MEPLQTRSTERNTAVAVALPAGLAGRAATTPARSAAATRVLRNAYALLAMTLLFSAGIAALGVAMKWPAPGLLLSLAKAHGRVKTREQLIEEVADREWDVFDRAIDMHISTLRKKLGDDPKEPRFIKTVRGYGYQLVTPSNRAIPGPAQ